jgi:hypothetical protein
LDSKVLPVLLHHPSMLRHGIICSLLCVCQELRECVQQVCVGRVAVVLRRPIAPGWLQKHAALVCSLTLDWPASMSRSAQAEAEAALGKQLAAVEGQLCLAAFTSALGSDVVVDVRMLKRLPVRGCVGCVRAASCALVQVTSSLRQDRPSTQPAQPLLTDHHAPCATTTTLARHAGAHDHEPHILRPRQAPHQAAE